MTVLVFQAQRHDGDRDAAFNIGFRPTADWVSKAIGQGRIRYNLVAAVDTDDIWTAFRLTNNIDEPWHTNPGVKRFFSGEACRSTSAGDILQVNEGQDGEIHLLNGFGTHNFTPYLDVELHARIYESLDNALENDTDREFLFNSDPQQVVDDLLDNDADVAAMMQRPTYVPKQAQDIVTEWRRWTQFKVTEEHA